MTMTLSLIIMIAILIFVVAVLIIQLGFMASILFGAPYVGTSSNTTKAMLELAGAGEQDVVLDIGCGLGNILRIALNDYHVKKVIGVDVNPVILFFAKWRFRKEIAAGRAQFYRAELAQLLPHEDATVVTTYLLDGLMHRIPGALKGKINPSARLISHGFKLPGALGTTEKRNGNTIHIYRMKDVLP